MKKITLILDLDGVLITTPPWKPEEMHPDGYSRFNGACVSNLNSLISKGEFLLVLSSTRRTVKSLEEFNQIFSNRNIHKEIDSFLPVYENCRTRKEEIEKYIEEESLKNYLILDDDKSLSGLDAGKKRNLVLTEMMKGFDTEKLTEAIYKIKGDDSANN